MAYSSKDIQKKANITKMQALHWTQLGIIVPLHDAHGRGGRREYSHQNLVEAILCRELNDFGIPTNVMGIVLQSLRIKYYRDYGSQKEKWLSFWEAIKKHKLEQMDVLLISGMKHIDRYLINSGKKFTYFTREDFKLMLETLKTTGATIRIDSIRHFGRHLNKCNFMAVINLEKVIAEAGGIEELIAEYKGA